MECFIRLLANDYLRLLKKMKRYTQDLFFPVASQPKNPILIQSTGSSCFLLAPGQQASLPSMGLCLSSSCFLGCEAQEC